MQGDDISLKEQRPILTKEKTRISIILYIMKPKED